MAVRTEIDRVCKEQEDEILEIIKENPKKDHNIIGFYVRKLPLEDNYEKEIRVKRTIYRLQRKGKIEIHSRTGSNRVGLWVLCSQKVKRRIKNERI